MQAAQPSKIPKVLIAEDEEKMARLLGQALTESGFEVTIACDGLEGTRLAWGQDVAIVDVMMPVVDGFAMVRELRREGNDVPVLFLTARDTNEDLIAGLTLGGDDYLVKPFRLAELVARLRSLLRRAARKTGELQHGDVTLNLKDRSVQRGERRLFLSSTEFRLLKAFMQQAGQILSKEELLKSVWSEERDKLSDGVVEVYVHYLRAKLEAFDQPRILTTVKGKGYVLEPSTQSY